MHLAVLEAKQSAEEAIRKQLAELTHTVQEQRDEICKQTAYAEAMDSERAMLEESMQPLKKLVSDYEQVWVGGVEVPHYGDERRKQRGSQHPSPGPILALLSTAFVAVSISATTSTRKDVPGWAICCGSCRMARSSWGGRAFV